MEAGEEVEGCFPGEMRSYDVVLVDGESFITAGRNLVASDEGEDVDDELDASTVESCLTSCQTTELCESVAYNEQQVKNPILVW